jgi:ADP-ribose pyrophosphatase
MHLLTQAALHKKARSKHPAYPERAEVTDEQVPWQMTFAEYEPTAFTHKVVLANNCKVKQNGWADPPDMEDVDGLADRKTFENKGVLKIDGKTGRPVNPRGRTGMCERGLLGKWGPNHAADPIVTRWHPDQPDVLQMVAIQRKDTGDWAIPGGMVDPGEHVSATVRREFEEEAGNLPKQKQARFKEGMKTLFAKENERFVYQGGRWSDPWLAMAFDHAYTFLFTFTD